MLVCCICIYHRYRSSTPTANKIAPTSTPKAVTFASTIVFDSNQILSALNMLGVSIGPVETPNSPYHRLGAPRGGGGLEGPA
jgi:hypothetical protein